MLKALKKRLKDQRGLTLIELLAVVVILGIIAAIAVPSIGNIIQNSREDAVQADAITVLNAAKLYQTQNDNDNAISADDLDDFIDNVSLTNYSVAVAADGTLSLTATGIAGTITVNFTAATYEDINADWDAPVSNVITVD